MAFCRPLCLLPQQLLQEQPRLLRFRSQVRQVAFLQTLDDERAAGETAPFEAVAESAETPLWLRSSGRLYCSKMHCLRAVSSFRFSPDRGKVPCYVRTVGARA
jgi:hypothetical protein